MAQAFLPPGARGYLAGEESVNQQNAAQLGQLSTLLNMRSGLLQQRQLENQIGERERLSNLLRNIPEIQGNPTLSFIAQTKPDALLPYLLPKPKDAPAYIPEGAAVPDPAAPGGYRVPAPRTHADRPPTRVVVQDKTSPTGWSHADAATGQILIKGAPPPTAPVEPTPIVQTDDEGVTRLYDRSGNLIKQLGQTGKPAAAVLKERQARVKLRSDLDQIIPNLEAISKDGGLIDQSTGSGAGALVDIGAAFFGTATPGSIAVGRLKPLVDPVLKLVPRFEGPQSDKDTQMYKDAAGDLANPNIPNDRKKAAAKTILEIYKRRRNQFTTTEYEAAVGPSVPSVPVTPRVVDW